jgi:hypothetical protein
MQPPSSVLPLEARQQLWSRLWERLLQPILDDDIESCDQDPETDDEAA